jgi:hypothetical protein
MIRAELIAEFREFDNLELFIEAFGDLWLETVTDSWNREIYPELIADLRYVPSRRAVHPFEFATPKSKRWYMWAVATGKIKTDGYGYVRTGKLVKGWSAKITIQDNAVVTSVRNPNKVIKWVTGNRQVPGHTVTGWLPHKDTIDFYRDESKRMVRRVTHNLLVRGKF